MKEKRPKIIVILGPTATGKSGLAVKIAKKFDGEIISADSRQVYKGLDIGTGKITKKEMRGIPHYMLDVISPKKTFTVAEFQRKALEKNSDILKRGKRPIVCGGTGFYIQSIVDSIVLPVVPPNISLRKKLERKSLPELQDILRKLDPTRYKNIDLQNPVRLIRAIEIATHLGQVPPLRQFNHKNSYEFLQIGLLPENLKTKIHERLESRMKKGMVSEAKKLYRNGLSLKRMRQLGLEYRLLAEFISKKITLKEFKTKLEREILRYSKRQMTWFKRDERVKWFKPEEFGKIQKEIKKFLAL